MSLLCSDFGVGFYFKDTLILCVYSCAAEFTISRKQSSFLFKTFIKRILEKWNIKDFRNNTSWSILKTGLLTDGCSRQSSGEAGSVP